MSFSLSYATMHNVLRRLVGRSVHEAPWDASITTVHDR